MKLWFGIKEQNFSCLLFSEGIYNLWYIWPKFIFLFLLFKFLAEGF